MNGQEEIDRQSAEDQAVLESHAAQLMERFDTVQIFATRHEPSRLNGTVEASIGQGNWFARWGQVRLWCEREQVKEASRENANED